MFRDFFWNLDSSMESELYRINRSFHRWRGENDDTMCYNLNSIRTYFIHSAREIPGVPIIYDKDVSTNRYELRIDNGQLLIAIGDKTILQTVKMLIESARDRFVHRVNDFLTEKNDIAKIYTNDLIPIIRDIVTSIDEEVPLAGGCGLPYCPKNIHKDSH